MLSCSLQLYLPSGRIKMELESPRSEDGLLITDTETTCDSDSSDSDVSVQSINIESTENKLPSSENGPHSNGNAPYSAEDSLLTESECSTQALSELPSSKAVSLSSCQSSLPPLIESLTEDNDKGTIMTTRSSFRNPAGQKSMANSKKPIARRGSLSHVRFQESLEDKMGVLQQAQDNGRPSKTAADPGVNETTELRSILRKNPQNSSISLVSIGTQVSGRMIGWSIRARNSSNRNEANVRGANCQEGYSQTQQAQCRKKKVTHSEIGIQTSTLEIPIESASDSDVSVQSINIVSTKNKLPFSENGPHSNGNAPHSAEDSLLTERECSTEASSELPSSEAVSLSSCQSSLPPLIEDNDEGTRMATRSSFRNHLSNIDINGTGPHVSTPCRDSTRDDSHPNASDNFADFGCGPNASNNASLFDIPSIASDDQNNIQTIGDVRGEIAAQSDFASNSVNPTFGLENFSNRATPIEEPAYDPAQLLNVRLLKEMLQSDNEVVIKLSGGQLTVVKTKKHQRAKNEGRGKPRTAIENKRSKRTAPKKTIRKKGRNKKRRSSSSSSSSSCCSCCDCCSSSSSCDSYNSSDESSDWCDCSKCEFEYDRRSSCNLSCACHSDAASEGSDETSNNAFLF